jgi:BASS family bile acid:Na+ symporter
MSTAPPSRIRRADRWVREHSLLLLCLTMVSSFSWPDVARKIFARGASVSIPLLPGHFDIPSLALSIIILAAAIRCTPRDYGRVFASRAGIAHLVSVYLVVPLLAAAVALMTLRIADGGALRGVAIGLALVVIVPIATTSAVWTRSSQGSVPVALSTIALSSLIAVFLLPPMIGRLAGAGGIDISSSIDRIRMQVLFAVAIPLVLGTSIRTLLPRVAGAIEPFLSLASMLVLLAFIGDTVASLRPHIELHTDLLAIALPFTVLTNALAYIAGYAIARARGLKREETIALVFSSGMRSTSTALVVAAICFPATPIVALPVIVWSFTQQILAGVITRRILRARDLAEPVLPLKRRVAQAAVQAAQAVAETAKRASRPAVEEIDEMLQETLVMAPRPRLPSHPG